MAGLLVFQQGQQTQVGTDGSFCQFPYNLHVLTMSNDQTYASEILYSSEMSFYVLYTCELELS